MLEAVVAVCAQPEELELARLFERFWIKTHTLDCGILDEETAAVVGEVSQTFDRSVPQEVTFSESSSVEDRSCSTSDAEEMREDHASAAAATELSAAARECPEEIRKLWSGASVPGEVSPFERSALPYDSWMLEEEDTNSQPELLDAGVRSTHVVVRTEPGTVQKHGSWIRGNAITFVLPDSASALAGLASQTRILTVNGEPVAADKTSITVKKLWNETGRVTIEVEPIEPKPKKATTSRRPKKPQGQQPKTPPQQLPQLQPPQQPQPLLLQPLQPPSQHQQHQQHQHQHQQHQHQHQQHQLQHQQPLLLQPQQPRQQLPLLPVPPMILPLVIPRVA
ncbi:hypothetical protein DIPPA_24361 [Diplonema papillatum]|nr:hypothetical protein DIPPA_24361 [Diplonema papillatum]